MAELSQRKLEEMVVGREPNPNAIFYEHAALNVPKSKEAGRRIYDKKVYIKLSNNGIKDSMSYEAQKADIQQYPEEYQYFLSNKQGTRDLGIEIIPNLDIAHLQELRDYGILTIPKLAAMEVVPVHLEYARIAAKVFNKALEDTIDGNQEKSIEESIEEGSEGGIQAVPETDRSEHQNALGQRKFPSSDSSNEVSGNPAGNEEGGQVQRNNQVSPNWSMSF